MILSRRQNNYLLHTMLLLGLFLGPLGYYFFSNATIHFEITNSYILVIIAGIFVGLGTRMGGGCTSGHGICGWGRS